MRELLRLTLLLAVVLFVPAVPFLLVGGHFEQWLSELAQKPLPAAASAALVIGLLSTDILLPIPSSVISTLSGMQLGWLGGTLATWIGMNSGAMLGFVIARQWGRPVAEWFANEAELDRLERVGATYGPLVLVLARAVPLFAEASVLVAGIHRLSWRRFLPAIWLSNLGIAIAYAAFGDYAARHEWLPLALGVSVALPVLVTVVVQLWLPSTTE